MYQIDYNTFIRSACSIVYLTFFIDIWLVKGHTSFLLTLLSIPPKTFRSYAVLILTIPDYLWQTIYSKSLKCELKISLRYHALLKIWGWFRTTVVLIQVRHLLILIFMIYAFFMSHRFYIYINLVPIDYNAKVIVFIDGKDMTDEVLIRFE